MNANDNDDGVNREGLDYRAGWVEAFGAYLQRLRLEAVRCRPKDSDALQLCYDAAMEMRNAMVAKMRGECREQRA